MTQQITRHDPRLTAWSAFLRAHARVVRELERELQAEQRMALTDYDVLVQLANAGDHRLRMSELADRLLLSRSGATRLVDRLVAQGLVTLMGSDGAARELRRLYGRDRAIEAMRRAMDDLASPPVVEDVDVVIDLDDAQPLTIDLRDGQIPSAVRQGASTGPSAPGWTLGSGAMRPAPKAAARRAVSAYAQRPGGAAVQRPDRTFWM